MLRASLLASIVVASLSISTVLLSPDRVAADDLAQAAAALKGQFAMMVHWSLSTFHDKQWTLGSTPISIFQPTGCDTDQWCEVAKAAGMTSICYTSNHHDGFCLWDTKTTDRKVTNSPLGKDVLAQLRNSCDKYGLKLGLYYSHGNWTWPGAVDGKAGAGGSNPEVKKAQLRELLTNYGPIDYIFFDMAVGVGGLSPADTNAVVKSVQPNCIYISDTQGECFDYNNGPAKAAPAGWLMADVSIPILLPESWFYTSPADDNKAMSAQEVYDLYKSCKQHDNLLLLDVGPDRSGRLRAIDAATLKKAGEMIRAANTCK